MDEKLEFDAEDLVAYLGGDEQFAAEMIDLFFSDTEQSVAGIKEAAAKGDYDAAYECAHALKGNAANIRAGIFRDYAQELATATRLKSAECQALLEQLDSQYARITAVLRGWQGKVRKSS